VSASALRPLLALRQGLAALGRQPRLALGFSALACGMHLLGWALFAAGHGSSSAVLALLLHGVGVVLYGASLIWLIEGLTHIGLVLGSGGSLRWQALCRWHGQRSRHLALGLLNTALALAATALAGFMAWSLVLFLLPALSILPALVGLLAVLAVGLSQLFHPCLVLAERLSPSRAFARGLDLLSHHWGGLLRLAPLLLALLLVPVALGLLAEAIGAGLGVVITALAMVAVLPLLAATVTAAYRQLKEGDR
jgi:hypothetical protein